MFGHVFVIVKVRVATYLRSDVYSDYIYIENVSIFFFILIYTLYDCSIIKT